MHNDILVGMTMQPVPSTIPLPEDQSILTAHSVRRADADAPFLAAARGQKPLRYPVWMMRQAGRSLPEYREIRKDIGMLESCFNPEVLAEITMQPVRRFDGDAAILFSDIVVPLKAAGVDIDIVAGKGPVLTEPVDSADTISALPTVQFDQLQSITEGISLVLEQLRADQVLIGFAGAPFTLASYLIEGGPSKNHVKTKALMYSHPELWSALMDKLTPSIITFLRVQLEAGVDAVQLFDSWAGFLTAADYRTFVAPYTAQIFSALAPYDVPRIHFGVGTGELLADMAEVGPDVVGVDWRVPLDTAASRFANVASESKALQGNLDPAVLFAGKDAIEGNVRRILREAATSRQAGTSHGHIFNLGHGVLPQTDPDAIKFAFDTVHSQEVVDYE